MSNPDSNDSDFENTVVEKLTFKNPDDSDDVDYQQQQQIQSDTITTGSTVSTAGTTPVPTIAEGDEENLSNSSGSSSSSNGSPKLTAEWTVHAQLTFRNKKPGEKTTKEFTNLNSSTKNNDPNNPIKVFYKWSSHDDSQSKDQNNETDKSHLDKEYSTTTTTSDIGTSAQKSSKIPLLTKRDKYEKKRQQSSLGKGHSESFRSTTTTADSGNSSSKIPRKPPKYGTRCKSTCNIILSAVADFIPTSKTGTTPEESEPFTFNTTATYTVSPEKETRDLSNQASQNPFSFSKICSLRDAFSQTSDTETKYLESSPQYPGYGVQEQLIESIDIDGKRKILKPYQQRRHTDTVMSTPNHRKTSSLPIEGGNSFMPSSFISPPQTHKSPSLPKIPPLPTQMLQNLANQAAGFGSTLESGTGGSSSKSDTKKPPRTVHIDVYCTGSDEEDDEEDDLDLSMSSEENKHDMESNSTPQTVLDTEQMILKHQRAGKSDLPRKFLNQQQQLRQQQHELQKFETSPLALQQSRSGSNIKGQHPQLIVSPQEEELRPNRILNVGHAITKSTTAEEINESKQLLFKKHIGDQRNNKLMVRNNKHLHKDMSDDAISSNYPNSSRSTMRDMTCSSISSKAMSSFDMESSWKETEISVGRTDSFDYDNHQDRLRIQKMEKLWSGSSGEQSFYQSDNFDPEDYHRLNYRSVQPSPETPPFRNTSPLKSYFSPNRSPDVSFRNQSPQKYNLNSPSNLYSSQRGHSYSTPPQQPYPSPGGQLFAQNLPNYNASPQPYLGPIHPPTPTRPMSPHQTRIQQFLQGYSQQTNETQHQQWRQRQYISDYELFPEPSKTSYYEFSNQTIPERDERANGSNKSPNYVPSPTSASPSQSSSNQNKYSTMPHYLSHQLARAQRGGSEDRPTFDLSDKRARVMFTADYNKSGSEASTLQSNLSGYTTEYLAKARRFGSVVTQMRKPGHHVGPAKNPDCDCEHCRRWFIERSEQQKGGEGRGRAYSMGDTPKGVFWLRRSHN